MPASLDETTIRLGAFIAIFVIMAGLELAFPRRPQTLPRVLRWSNNLGIVVINTLLLRLLFPILAVGVAIWAQGRGWGLFNLIDLPPLVEIVLAVILLDLAIYAQHVAAHKIPLLWRLHQVHHADIDIDLTTGARFHPVEIWVSMLYKMVIVILIGAPPVAVIAFEVILNALAMFNHANFAMPLGLDKIVRKLFVTPDFHRVHHSVIRCETDSNYGFNLSVWDRIFGTYIAQPQKGHDAMSIGLAKFRDKKTANILWCLALPFRDKA